MCEVTITVFVFCGNLDVQFLKAVRFDFSLMLAIISMKTSVRSVCSGGDMIKQICYLGEKTNLNQRYINMLLLTFTRLIKFLIKIIVYNNKYKKMVLLKITSILINIHNPQIIT